MDETVEGRNVRREEVGPVSITIEAPADFPVERLDVILNFSRYTEPLNRAETLAVIETMGGVATAEPITPSYGGGDSVTWRSPDGARLSVALPEEKPARPEFSSALAAELAARQKDAQPAEESA